MAPFFVHGMMAAGMINYGKSYGWRQMRQITKVLTTTNQQGLSNRQAGNARENINAQVKLDNKADSKVSLVPEYDAEGNLVGESIKVDSDYIAGSAFVTVDNELHQIDLSEQTKECIDSIPQPANDGVLTISLDGKEYKFSADSADDVTVPIHDTTYPLADEDTDGLLSKEGFTKLKGIADGAQKNVQSDWNAEDGDAFIQNKPTEFPPSAHSHAIEDVNGLASAIDVKVDKVYGKGLSTNDYTNVDKSKLEGIEGGAQKNVQSDWNATSGDAFIQNKPTEFPPSAHSHPVSEVEGLAAEIESKVDKESGKGLSSNDYSDDEQTKLAGIEEGAQVNVQADWNATSGDAFIQNKPSVYTTDQVYTKGEVDSKLNARAVFYASKDKLPDEGDSSKTYYVGPTGEGRDKYDVYVWDAAKKEYTLVDESEISLTGYWHGEVQTFGQGNAVTEITKNSDDTITVTKDKTFALIDELPTNVSELKNDAEYITEDDVTADTLLPNIFSSDNSIDVSKSPDPEDDSKLKVNLQVNNEYASTITPAKPFDKLMCDTVLGVPMGDGESHTGAANVRGVLMPIMVPSGRIESISMFPEAYSGAGNHILYLGLYGNDADTIDGAYRWLGVYGANMGPASTTFSFEGHSGDANIVGTMVDGLPYIVKKIYIDPEGVSIDINGRAAHGDASTVKKFMYNWMFLAVVNDADNGGTRCFGYTSPVGRIGSELYRKKAGIAWVDQFTQEQTLFAGDQFIEQIPANFSENASRLHSTDLAFPYIQFNIVK